MLSAEQARATAAHAYEELQLPMGAPAADIVASFRRHCLYHALGLTSAHDNDNDNNNSHEQGHGTRFQRQAVAYRFLRSLPLLEQTVYEPDQILARLRPLAALPPGEHYHGHRHCDRASGMLDICIASLEQAQGRGQRPYINYVLTVHYCLRKHVVRRRYSEFQALHTQLASQLPVLPELPPSSWLDNVWMTTASSTRRRAQQLTTYLHRVIALLAARSLFAVEVMAFLEIDHSRVRAEEEALAVELLARELSVESMAPPGQRVHFLVASHWLNKWKQFVTDPRKDPPLSIDNRSLVKRCQRERDWQLEWERSRLAKAKAAAEAEAEAEEAEELAADLQVERETEIAIKRETETTVDPEKQRYPYHPQAPRLVAGVQYRCVNQCVWAYWMRVYGGGPAVMRGETNILAPDVPDLLATVVVLQRLVRGFLGRCRARHLRAAKPELQDPLLVRRLTHLRQEQELAERMAAIQQYVEARMSQTRVVAVIKMQRAVRRFLLRLEHQLLLAESAVPMAADSFEHVDEYCSLEEIALMTTTKKKEETVKKVKKVDHVEEEEQPEEQQQQQQDEEEEEEKKQQQLTEAQLAQFLVTMNKGVPIQKLRSRRKEPQWRLFRIDAIGSQLQWSSKKSAHAVAFAAVVGITVESPLRLKRALLPSRHRRPHVAHAVVVGYREREQQEGASRELMLVCERECEQMVLAAGLRALVAETQRRTAHGATYVDGHGTLRKKYAHAKDLIHRAQQLIASPTHAQ